MERISRELKVKKQVEQATKAFKTCIAVNIFGGPGTGKSTTAAGVFHVLKRAGVNCELITEYAKELVWKEEFEKLKDQWGILEEQSGRQEVVRSKVDVLITDCPILMSNYYGKDMSQDFKEAVREKFNQYDNLNYLLIRNHKYDPVGRTQKDEKTANEVHDGIKKVMDEEELNYKSIRTQSKIEDIFSMDDTVQTIVKDVLEKLNTCYFMQRNAS